MHQPLTPETKIILRRAKPEDLEAIISIEKSSFSAPWPAWSLQQELKRPDAVYLIAQVDEYIAGYAGMWLILDEGHVGTIAVLSHWRGCGLGEVLMLGMLQIADREKLERIFLEYRISNTPAETLYRKLGFETTRIRKRYYVDNNEDAVEVVLPDLNTPERRAHLAQLRQIWEVRHERPLPVAP